MNPIIKVSKQGNQWRLMSYTDTLGLLPAGPRLLRLNPPQIRWVYDDPALAWAAAKKLQKHIDDSPSLSKYRQRKMGDS